MAKQMHKCLSTTFCTEIVRTLIISTVFKQKRRTPPRREVRWVTFLLVKDILCHCLGLWSPRQPFVPVTLATVTGTIKGLWRLRVYIFCFWAWLTLFLYSTSNTQGVKRPNELYSIYRFSQKLNNKSSFRLAKSLHSWLRFILYADRHKKSLYAKIFHITKCILESNKIVLKKTRLRRRPFQ